MDIDYRLALSFSKLAIDVFFKGTVLLVCALVPLSGFTAWCDRPYCSPKAVAETGGQNRITELMEMLDADCCEDGLIAVKALATKTDNPKAIAALRKALQDEAAQVRQVAEEFFPGKQVGD